MIQKLESAGLGYHVSADETEDKLGRKLNKKPARNSNTTQFLGVRQQFFVS